MGGGLQQFDKLELEEFLGLWTIGDPQDVPKEYADPALNCAFTPSSVFQRPGQAVKFLTGQAASPGILHQELFLTAAPFSRRHLLLYATAGNPTLRMAMQIVAGANASPTTLTVVGNHGLPSAMTIEIAGATGAWAAINGTRIVTKIDGSNFTIPIDTSTFGAFTGTVYFTMDLLAGLPATTVHFRIAPYNDRAVICFSDAYQGTLPPYLYDPTWAWPNIMPFALAAEAQSSLTFTQPAAGSITPGEHYFGVLAETRSGWVGPAFKYERSGTVTTSVSGLDYIVAWVSGDDFTAIAPGQKITINYIEYTVDHVITSILLHLTTTAGAQTAVAYYTTWPKFTAENYVATGTFTGTDVPHDGDTVTIDTKTYTWRTGPLTTIEGEVLIGGTLAAALDNLKSAINFTGLPGIDYTCLAMHPTVEATTNTDTTQVVAARTSGTAGNSIVTTSACTHGGWGAATLTLGGPHNLVIANLPVYLDQGLYGATYYAAHVTKLHIIMTQANLLQFYVVASLAVGTATVTLALSDTEVKQSEDAAALLGYRHTLTGQMVPFFFNMRLALLGDGSDSSLVLFSEPDAPENFNAATGFQVVRREDAQRLTNTFQQGDTLYYTKERALWATQDNGGQPYEWSLFRVAGVGASGPSCVAGGGADEDNDKRVAYLLEARGFYKFDGGEPTPNTKTIRPTWLALNNAAFARAEVRVDVAMDRVLVLVPGVGLSVPNQMIVFDILEEKTKRSIWTFAGDVPSSLVVDGAELLYVSADGSYVGVFDAAVHADLIGPATKVAIAQQYRCGAVCPRKEGLNLFRGVTMRVLGAPITSTVSVIVRAAGVVTVTTTADHLLKSTDKVDIAGVAPTTFNGLDITVTVLNATQFTYANAGANEAGAGGTITLRGLLVRFYGVDEVLKLTKTLALTANPAQDITNQINIRHERLRVDLSCNNVDEHFDLCRMRVYAKPHGYRSM
jgi:hypothetical protein